MYRIGETGITFRNFDLRYARVNKRLPWEGWNFETGEIVSAATLTSLRKKIVKAK